jgi:hypothetical protein
MQGSQATGLTTHSSVPLFVLSCAQLHYQMRDMFVEQTSVQEKYYIIAVLSFLVANFCV